MYKNVGQAIILAIILTTIASVFHHRQQNTKLWNF
jgi:hypothetical protein